MTKLKTALTALMLSATALMVVAPPAAAQGTVIMVIDEGRIVAESKAGKDMFTKLKNIETQINTELKPTLDALEAERQALATRLDGKTREAIAADAALVKQIGDFQRKSEEFAQKRTMLSQEYAATEQKSFIYFNSALEPVMLEVVK